MNAQRDKRLLVHATSVIPGKASVPFASAVEATVLLFGDSGSGKSDVALRLIAMGGQLLSDDQTELFVESGRLFAAAPEPLRNYMEIRGVGIVKFPACSPAAVLLCVRLGEGSERRFPDNEYYMPQGIALSAPPRLFRLNGFDASTPAKIAAAAAALQSASLLPGDGTFL